MPSSISLDSELVPEGFTPCPLAFIPDIYIADPKEVDGIYHVTVALERVLSEGLKSRRQLGYEVQGLGGGAMNAAPDKVSVTWSSGKAAEIECALRLAVAAAQDGIMPSEIMTRVWERYGAIDWIGPSVKSALRKFGVTDDVLDDDMLTDLDEHLDSLVRGGGEKYRLLQELDDAFEMEMRRDMDPPQRVGLTAPFEMVRDIEENQIGTVLCVLDSSGSIDCVAEECELRVEPRYVRVLGRAEDFEMDTCSEAADQYEMAL